MPDYVPQHVVERVRFGTSRETLCVCGETFSGKTDAAMSDRFTAHVRAEKVKAGNDPAAHPHVGGGGHKQMFNYQRTEAADLTTIEARQGERLLQRQPTLPDAKTVDG